MPGRLGYRGTSDATTVPARFLLLGWVIVPGGSKPWVLLCVLEFNEKVLVPQELLDHPNKFLWAFQMRQMS